MGKRLYVANVPYKCDEAQLRALFEQEGRQVEEVKIVTDRETGRPRGFAFVELATDAQAQAAVSALNGKPFGGRPLTVSEARERAPGGGGGGGGGGGRGMGRRGRQTPRPHAAGRGDLHPPPGPGRAPAMRSRGPRAPPAAGGEP